MAQRIGNVEQWQLLSQGEKAHFHGELRTVAIEVNAPEAINLYVLCADEPGLPPAEETFLARVLGRDRIEFTVPGDFGLYSDGGDLWFFTTDDDNEVNIEVAPEVYTKLADRKDRNPNLEAIEWRMRQNVERRMAQLAEEADRRLADVERTYTERARSRFAPPEPVSEPEDDAGAPSKDDAPKAPKDAKKAGDDKPPAGAKPKAPASADDK